MNADALLLGGLIINGLLAVVLLLIARFVFSIGRIVRNQDKLIKILSGIANKMEVDSNYLR